jgi:hypothetical protein
LFFSHFFPDKNIHLNIKDISCFLFRLIDLDREGLSEYKAALQKLGVSSGSESPAFTKAVSSSAFGDEGFTPSLGTTNSTSTGYPQPTSSSASGVHLSLISEIFNQIDRN